MVGSRRHALGKFFGLVVMLVALYLGMTLYTKGIEGAFGGVFAPIEPANDRDAPLATHLTPASQLAEPPSDRERRVWVTDAVRERVTSDLDAGARRRGY
jgi:hypothetical protein